MKHCLDLLTTASEVSAQDAAPAVAFPGSAVPTPLATRGCLPSVPLWCSIPEFGVCSRWCHLCPSCSQGHTAMPIWHAQQCIEGRSETGLAPQHCRAELSNFPSVAPLVKERFLKLNSEGRWCWCLCCFPVNSGKQLSCSRAGFL